MSRLTGRWRTPPKARRGLSAAFVRGVLATGLLLALAACNTVPDQTTDTLSVDQRLMRTPLEKTDLQTVDRLTWGASPTSAAHYAALGRAAYLRQQLHPDANLGLPPAIQAQIAAYTISKVPLTALVAEHRLQTDAIRNAADTTVKQAAQQTERDFLNTVAREAAQRALLRDIYGRDQLREQLVWFWFNHFNVTQNKADIRLYVGDFEEHALRPHALGKFRDLLAATLRHPAMLLFLDNSQNAVNRVNENYAREIMELHTMGVGSGYTQTDVQELARILTGVGVNERTNASDTPSVRGPHAQDYQRHGAFEFNPNRHDYGTKHFLGHTIQGTGMHEVDQALALIADSPATAKFISRKLALAFVSDNPPSELVDHMATVFEKTDGDIADVMQTMIDSPAFAASLGKKLKDPMHFALSAVRLAYDTRPIATAAPIGGWLARMGEPLYGRETPDGYPLDSAAWAGPGQMTVRFDIARGIGSGSAGLFRVTAADGHVTDEPAFPQIHNALYLSAIEPTLGSATRHALSQATSPQDWNMLFLSSPEFMHR